MTEFDQILHMHWYWQDLDWDYYKSIFADLEQSYGPWLMLEFCFWKISWEQIDAIWPDFAYAIVIDKI